MNNLTEESTDAPHKRMILPGSVHKADDLAVIGIDCIALPTRFSGAANYIYHLAIGLLQSHREFRLIIFCKPDHVNLFKSYLQDGDKIFPVPIRNRLHQLYFYEYGLQKILLNENVSLFHATHYICPPIHPDYKIITTFHDMGFIQRPAQYPRAKRLYFGNRIPHFLRRADLVITVSKTTQNSVSGIFPQYRHKLRIIYPGTDHLKPMIPLRGTNEQDSQKFILSVNSFEKRKNIPFIINLFNHLKAEYHLPHQLVLIGHANNGYSEILKTKKRSPYRTEIKIRQSVSETELTRFYGGADFFINASEYEGFGFTPFEALAHHLPVFLLENGVTSEIFGSRKVILTKPDISNWAKVIMSEINCGFKNRITKDTIDSLSWDSCVRQVSQAYASTINIRSAARA
ncbi:MAG: glycosyltransferase family 4 protein [Calditrichaceae bacterium]